MIFLDQCMNIFLGLLGMNDFFHLILPYTNVYFLLRPPSLHNFSNGPLVISKYIAFFQFQVVAVVVLVA